MNQLSWCFSIFHTELVISNLLDKKLPRGGTLNKIELLYKKCEYGTLIVLLVSLDSPYIQLKSF